MRKKIVLSIFSATFLYAATTPAPPESPGIQQQKLNEIDKTIKTKQSKAIIDNLNVSKEAEGQGENRIKGPTFVLQNVSITGNTVLDKNKIIDIVKKYVGKNVDSIDLKSISQEITDLYKKDGYVTSKCIIPAQKVQNGDVKFEIIEDKLGRVVLQGESTYNYDSNLFMRYLADLQGKIINANELNKRLQILSNLPVTKITPSLQKTNQGFTNLVLEITESAENFSITMDNSGSVYTGEQRFTLNGNINNIRGKSDRLALSLTTVKESKFLTSFSSSYISPFGKKGGSLSFGYSHMYYQLNPEKVGTNTAIYEGETDIISLNYSQPLYWYDNSNLSFNYGFEKKSVSSQTILNNNGYVLIDGKDDLFTLNGNIFFAKPDKLFSQQYLGINSINIGIKKALSGFWNSMTQEDLDRKQYKFDDNTVGYGLNQTLDGPIKFGNGLNPSFTKYYYDLTRQQQLPYEITSTLQFSGDYTKDRVPDSYEYSGGDYGYAYALSFAKRFGSFDTSVSASQSKVYTYATDMSKTSLENSPSLGLGLSTSYKDVYLSLSYASSFDTWDSNTNNIRYSIRYNW